MKQSQCPGTESRGAEGAGRSAEGGRPVSPDPALSTHRGCPGDAGDPPPPANPGRSPRARRAVPGRRAATSPSAPTGPPRRRDAPSRPASGKDRAAAVQVTLGEMAPSAPQSTDLPGVRAASPAAPPCALRGPRAWGGRHAYLGHPAAAAVPGLPARVPGSGRPASASARRAPPHPTSGRRGPPRRSGRLPVRPGRPARWPPPPSGAPRTACARTPAPCAPGGRPSSSPLPLLPGC